MIKQSELVQRAKAAIALAQLRFALKNDDWDSAKNYVDIFHNHVQNIIVWHTISHLYSAKIGYNEQRWKHVFIQLYLASMAPYGTLQRRWKGVKPEEPNPPGLTVFLLKIGHKLNKSLNAG